MQYSLSSRETLALQQEFICMDAVGLYVYRQIKWQRCSDLC
jgi:hypothetical protein